MVNRQSMAAEVGARLTDERLVSAEYRGRVGRGPGDADKRWLVVYGDGTHLVLAVAHSEAARVYAREYGVRFLGGAKVVSVRWMR